MIVKNEEESIGRILSQAKKFADEIIVVDTGSSDNTISIAKRYTKNIFSYPWCDDFSKARNFSLSKATCDYTMWLDADDYITPSNIAKLKALKNSTPPADVYMLKYCMGQNRNTAGLTYYRERIFKTSLNLRFLGAVHEAIPPTGIVEYKNICIQHKKVKPADPKRNLKIYNKLLKSGASLSARDKYYYGRELYYQGYYKKATKVLCSYLREGDSFLPNVAGATMVLADIYTRCGQIQKAISTILNYIKTSTPSSEMCCKLGEYFDKLGQANLSIFWYKSALNCNEIVGGFNNADFNKFVPYMELCRLTYPLNLAESRHYHNLAKRIHPNHPSVVYNMQFFN